MEVSTFNSGRWNYVFIKSAERDLSLLQEFDESPADTIKRDMLRTQAEIARLNRRLAFLDKVLQEAQL